jgi:hypothetical protein
MVKTPPAHHKSLKQSTRRSGLMSSAARCGPLDTKSRSEERSPSKADPRQQYEDMARPYQQPAADAPLPELQQPDRSRDRLIKKSEAQELLGRCSHMTLKRLSTNPASGFPQPVYLGRHPHFWFNDIVAWINKQARQPRQPSPQAKNIARAHAARRAAREEAGHG